YINTTDPSWDDKTVRILNQERSEEPIAIVRIDCFAHMLGPPNDEAFSGHPLASRGLKPYRAFRIEGSSWIRRLEQMNRVHKLHKPERFRAAPSIRLPRLDVRMCLQGVRRSDGAR